MRLQHGQTLIEVAIAVALSMVVITALLTTVLSSLSSAENSRTQNEATQYSQEALEILRSLPNLTTPGTYCLDEGSTTLSDRSTCSSPNVASRFIRTVVIRNGMQDCGDNALASVQVITSWRDGKCAENTPYCKNSTLQSCFSNL